MKGIRHIQKEEQKTLGGIHHLKSGIDVLNIETFLCISSIIYDFPSLIHQTLNIVWRRGFAEI